MAGAASQRADARLARTQGVISGLRLARWRMQREVRPSKDVTRFHEVMALFARGATEQEVIEAAAGLAVAPDAKQGSLL